MAYFGPQSGYSFLSHRQYFQTSKAHRLIIIRITKLTKSFDVSKTGKCSITTPLDNVYVSVKRTATFDHIARKTIATILKIIAYPSILKSKRLRFTLADCSGNVFRSKKTLYRLRCLLNLNYYFRLPSTSSSTLGCGALCGCKFSKASP